MAYTEQACAEIAPTFPRCNFACKSDLDFDCPAHRKTSLRLVGDLVSAQCQSVFLGEGAAVLAPTVREGFVTGDDIKEFFVDRLLPDSMKSAIQVL